MAGTLFVVATPIGNLEDITARALRVLREVSLIAAEDTRRTSHLLAHYGIRTPTTSLHEHNERQKSPSLINRLADGESIAVVSDAGTPTLSDPGMYLIRSAIEAGVRVEAVPGPSALTTALSASGIDATTFTFLGFPPTRAKARSAWFERLRRVGGTVVFYESPHRLRPTLEDLRRTTGNVSVVLGRELTKAHEELVRGQIDMVIQSLTEPRGEFVVIAEIGESTESGTAETPDASQIAQEFVHLTKSLGFSRRQAISSLSRKYALAARDVYSMLEQAKNSG